MEIMSDNSKFVEIIRDESKDVFLNFCDAAAMLRIISVNVSAFCTDLAFLNKDIPKLF